MTAIDPGPALTDLAAPALADLAGSWATALRAERKAPSTITTYCGSVAAFHHGARASPLPARTAPTRWPAPAPRRRPRPAIGCHAARQPSDSARATR